MDEEQALASPIAGGIRGIRRSVSSSVFTGRAVAPPPQPDPQVTSLLNQNSLTLTSISSQLSNVSAQVGGLNNSLNVIKDNLALSDQLDRQREAAKQKREAVLAEQSLREGKESQLERKIQTALLTPVRRVSVRAQGILSRLGNFLLVLAGGWLVNSTLNFLRLKSEGNVDALNKFKVQFLGTLALMTGIGTLMTVGISKIIGLLGTLAGAVLRITFSGLIKKPFLFLFKFISSSLANFIKFAATAGQQILKTAPQSVVSALKRPVQAIAGAALSIPLVGPVLRKTGEIGSKIPFIGGAFKQTKGFAGGGPAQALFETIGFGLNVRNRVREDKDGDGVGGQTTGQAILGAGTKTVASLASFFTALAVIPEPSSSIVGTIGLIALGIGSNPIGGAAESQVDKLTGANKANEESFKKNNAPDAVEVAPNPNDFSDGSDSITPNSNSKDVSSLQFSEDANILTVPFGAGGMGGDDDGGVPSPAGGSSDNLPTISSSDNSNNFPALAGSLYNIAEV